MILKKDGRHICFTLVCAVVMSFIIVSTAGAQEGNWGLGYGEPGATPQGNETADFLKKYDAYYVGDGNENVVYLTFDAGYENGNTEKILDTLKEKNVPAAFFLVGTYIRDNPALVERMVAEGHIVANHTMTHPDMSAISDRDAFIKELQGTEAQYKELIGQDMPQYYRPPRGQYSELNMQMAKELGYKSIFWSLAYVDWYEDKQPTKEEAFSKLIPRLHPGTVLLLHSTSKTNADILGDLIEEYTKLGYQFETLDHLIGAE